jgi:hypothetical protein
MNLEKTIRHQRLTIGLLLILLIFITICCYRYELEATAIMVENEKLYKENESLYMQTQYQKSVIMDLEEYLKEK